MRLLVVESPTKASKIRKMGIPDLIVLPSVGHIRDLPKKELGVSLETFELHYVLIDGKQEVIDALKSATREVGNTNVYLGTDPDREGEAIAAHLEAVLGLRDPKRVSFHDIERKAILKALETPVRIDRKLVAAQEARRGLDRIEGYGVSGILRERTGQNWTAGRTQSPGLRLVVEREEEIRKFTSISHCSVRLSFDLAGKPWVADWAFKRFLADGQKYWTDRPFAERVAKLLDVRVIDRKDKEVSVSPPPAFTTSTLQQAGSASLRFGTKKTMDLAQKLHEKGYISYHATDNPNLSVETAEIVRAHAAKLKYPLSPEVRMVKVSAAAQGGHNAICPTHIEVRDGRSTADPLTADEQALYDLIWRRTVASQMADARYDARMLQLEAIEQLDGQAILFVAEGRTEKFKGFREIAAKDATVDPTDTAESNNPVPALNEGALLHADEGKVKDKKTPPPTRYTQATLVKALESRNIGRPRTFATIVETILRRAYVEERKEGRTPYLFPTEEGEANMSLVRGNFAVADLGYTKLLEERFDAIAAGSATFFEVVKQSYVQYLADKAKFATFDTSKVAAVVTGGACPKCHTGVLVRKSSKPKPGASASEKRYFWGCNRYAEGACTASFRDRDGKPDFTERAPVVEGETCPQCKTSRLARRVNEDGRAWWGCQGYTNGCKATYPDIDGVADLNRAPATSGGSCGACKSGTLYRRERKTGGYFWTCSGYGKTGKDHCEAIFDDLEGKPDTVNRIPCPKCRWGALRPLKGPKGPFWACSARTCKTAMDDVDGKPDPGSAAWQKSRSRGRDSSTDGVKKTRTRSAR